MRLQLIALVAAGALAGCLDDERLAEPPAVDREVFDAEVYPLLLRDCGFPACHGSPDRFFRVFGPGRTRLEPSSSLYDPPTDAEREAAFDRARSMLAAVPDPSQSLLLRKPLEESAGGGAHLGLDALGRNVYPSTEDPSWRTIASWAGAASPEVPRDAGPEPDGGGVDGGRVDAGPVDAGPVEAGARDAGEDAP